MTEDIVRSLGFLTMGSRLKRIGERLQAETQRIMDDADVGIAASQFPLLAALDSSGPLSIGELALALGVAQPGVTRSVTQLAALALVGIEPADDDQRRRIVSLTGKGRRLVETSRQEVWPRVERAVADLCADLSGSLLQQLAGIEDGLAEKSLRSRARTTGRPS